MLEHPDITNALATGYPMGYVDERAYCEECGRDITEERIYEDATHEFLCVKCLLYLHEKNWW